MKRDIESQRGVGLIEVLVALLVLSIGLLGVAKMQALSKRVHHEAMQRTLAVFLVNGIIGRMKSNASALADYATTSAGGSTAAAPSVDCTNAASCTAKELAAYDLWQWGRELAGATEQFTNKSGSHDVGGLLDPTGCITITNSSAKITLVWTGLTETTIAKGNKQACGTAGKYRQQLVVNTVITE